MLLSHKQILTSTFLLLSLDFLYISMVKKTFENQLLQIQKTPMQVRYGSLIACYVFLLFGFWFFILKNHCSVMDAFLLGLVIYGIYETTNYATIKNWSIYFVLGDTLWGGILFALTTFLTYQINS